MIQIRQKKQNKPYYVLKIRTGVRMTICTYPVLHIQWSPSITDTTGTKDFVLYSEVFFAQEVIVDHAPLIIVSSYAGARPWTMKSVVLMKDLLLFSP